MEFFRSECSRMLYHIERILSADELPVIYEHIWTCTVLPYFESEQGCSQKPGRRACHAWKHAQALDLLQGSGSGSDRQSACNENNEGHLEMSINGIGTAGYPQTGYTARKMERSVESGTVGFMERVEEKAAQHKATDYDDKAFEMVGSNALQEVKDAWMDAAKEVNANGMGIRGNGKMSHISQMMVQQSMMG